MTCNITLKYIVIGDVLAGKTSIVNKYTGGHFFSRPSPTIGVDFEMKTELLWHNDERYDIINQIWDTSGDESYQGLVSNYYKNVDVVLMVFDLTCYKSFLNVKKHYLNITNYLNINNPNKKVRLMLVGNKKDKLTREVLHSNARNYARTINVPYYEVSSKEGDSVFNMFNSISVDIICEIDVMTTEEKTKLSIIKRYNIPTRPLVKEKNNSCCLFGFLFK